MQIEGTATISLETLDKMRREAEMADEILKKYAGLTEEVMAVYDFEAETYHEELKRIDNNRKLTDEQIMKQVSKAMVKHLKIVVDAEALKRFIKLHIDPKESDEHADIKNATAKELQGIQVILKGQQVSEEQAEQPDLNLCRICEEYMEDESCEHLEDGSCPAAGIMKRLKEAEKTIKAKEKIIKDRDKTIREIRKKLEDSENARSYMVDPMAIGDRHEMGG